MVALLIAFPGLVGHDTKPLPWAQTLPGIKAPHAGAGDPLQNRGFSLPPYPPAIPGAPPPITSGPGAPTLDLSNPPVIVRPPQ
jgi:hypothetical protein